MLLTAVIVSYSPVWWAGYVWDDDVYSTANPRIIGPLGLKEIWTTSAADISPLTITTFWLEHALWGLTPLPYHLVNVFLHAACAVVLWQVLRNLRVPGAWLGAALWALHPVQVESVAWVTETKNAESGLFYLLAALFFLRWLRGRDLRGGGGNGWNYGLTFLFAVLAMASKSSTVILPLELMLGAWWMEGRWQWRNLVAMGPIFLSSIAASALSVWTQGLNLAETINPQAVRTWPERLIMAGDAVGFYLGKLLWPYPLMAIYPPWRPDAGSVFSYFPLLAVIGLLAIFWLKRDSWARPWFFVFAYFLMALLPVLGLVDNPIFAYSLVFDHFQYLASMGPLALAGTGLVRSSELIRPEKPWLLPGLGVGWLLVLGIVSWQRAWVYQSEKTLWADAVVKDPNNWVGYYNLGTFSEGNWSPDEKLAWFQKSLAINPDYAPAHNNLGLVLEEKGEIDAATAQFEKALNLDSNYAAARYNVGRMLQQKGQVDAAIGQYEKALEIDPNFAAVHSNLGAGFYQKGQLDAAMIEFRKAVEIDPNYADAHSNLGACLFQAGRMDEAIVEYQKALAIHPTDAGARRNLGLAFFRTGRLDEAIGELQRTLEINPGFADAHTDLGNALLQKGRLDEAIAQFKGALQLEPNDSQARSNLVRAEAAQEASGSH